MKKKVSLLLALVLCVSALGGCSAFSGRNATDYGAYVRSYFDVDYKGEVDTYLELTNDTRENAEMFYDSTMEWWACIIADWFSFYDLLYDESGIADEAVKERMIATTKDIFKHVKYEVADAVKSGDDYTVKVTIYPINFSDVVGEPYNEYYNNDFQERILAGEFGDIENDDEAYKNMLIIYANDVIDIIDKYVADLDYLDPVIRDIRINVDENGNYGIDESLYSDTEEYLLQ